VRRRRALLPEELWMLWMFSSMEAPSACRTTRPSGLRERFCGGHVEFRTVEADEDNLGPSWRRAHAHQLHAAAASGTIRTGWVGGVVCHGGIDG
jgi:hypothetical protein